MKTIFVNWGGHNVKLTWHPQMNLNHTKTVTSVHAICIQEGKVLLAHIKNRGFNFPGGHLENEESNEDAVVREVYEEAYVRGTIKYIGAIEVSHEENPQYDPNGKYPLIAYQAFYKMDITECLPFLRENESLTRIWVEPSEVPYIIDDHELSTLIMNEALEIVN